MRKKEKKRGKKRNEEKHGKKEKKGEDEKRKKKQMNLELTSYIYPTTNKCGCTFTYPYHPRDATRPT